MIVLTAPLLLAMATMGWQDRVSSELAKTDEALASGNYTSAVALARGVIDLNGRDARGHERLGAALSRTGDLSGALLALTTALELARSDEQPRIQQAIRGFLPLVFDVKRTNMWRAVLGRDPDTYPRIVVGKTGIQVQQGDRQRSIPCSEIQWIDRPRAGRLVIAISGGDTLEFDDSFPGSRTTDMAAAAAASACGVVSSVDQVP